MMKTLVRMDKSRNISKHLKGELVDLVFNSKI